MAENSQSPPLEIPLRLFDAYGIEVEYMLVDGERLDVAPAADQLLESVAGEHTDEFENDTIAWNNELALHVIEFKCNGPRRSLSGLSDDPRGRACGSRASRSPRSRRLM